jgi:hypothetical protein
VTLPVEPVADLPPPVRAPLDLMERINFSVPWQGTPASPHPAPAGAAVAVAKPGDVDQGNERGPPD